MRLHKYCLGLFLFPILQLTAQQAELKTNSGIYQLAGRVTNEKGELLEGASIFLPAQNRSSVSDKEGKFQFKNLIPGTFELQISFIGFEHYSCKVMISEKPTEYY